jgi:hypothetical protein
LAASAASGFGLAVGRATATEAMRREKATKNFMVIDFREEEEVLSE